MKIKYIVCKFADEYEYTTHTCNTLEEVVEFVNKAKADYDERPRFDGVLIRTIVNGKEIKVETIDF